MSITTQKTVRGKKAINRSASGVGSASAFIKWVGGKQTLAKELVKYFPSHFDQYFEPFLGGGSVFFLLSPARAKLTDSNAWLIDTYTAVRDDWARVASILDGLKNTKEEFLRVRGIRPDLLEKYTKAAHFIYLNKTCFRGLFRVNRMELTRFCRHFSYAAFVNIVNLS